MVEASASKVVYSASHATAGWMPARWNTRTTVSQPNPQDPGHLLACGELLERAPGFRKGGNSFGPVKSDGLALSGIGVHQ